MGLKKFKNFINEGKVFFESDFYEVLKKLKDSNKIANHLFDIQGKEFDKMKIGLVGFSDNNKRLKFKSFDKLKKEIENYRGGSRGYIPGGNGMISLDTDDDIDIVKPSRETNNIFMAFEDIIKSTKDEAKIGRILRKILKSANINDFKDSDIEEFVNIVKTEFKTINDEFKNFELVSGDDINKYYLCDNYSEEGKGVLGKSCMKYKDRNNFMDFYALNPESVNLLIYKDPKEEDKILGRALVWFNAEDIVSNEKTTFMDRVYYTYDSDEKLFEKYANIKGWSHLGNTTPNHKIKVKPGRYKKYPYLDSFSYYNFIDGYITNESELFDYDDVIDLQDTNGGYDCYECDGNFEDECDECYGEGEQQCNNCWGSSEVYCGECYGNGEVNCEECSGDGYINCEECDGEGEDEDGNTCEECSGDGEVDCEECHGQAEVTCQECQGSGNQDCDECDPYGNVECGECNGEGSKICTESACQRHYDQPLVN